MKHLQEKNKFGMKEKQQSKSFCCYLPETSNWFELFLKFYLTPKSVSLQCLKPCHVVHKHSNPIVVHKTLIETYLSKF